MNLPAYHSVHCSTLFSCRLDITLLKPLSMILLLGQGW